MHAFYNGARATRPLLVDVGESPTLLFHTAMLGSTQSLITLIAAFFIMERGRLALCWWMWASRPHSFFHSAMLGSTQSLITLLAAFFIMERGRPALSWWTWASRPTLLFIYALACWVQFRMCSFLFCSSRLRIQSCRFARNSLFSSI